MFLSLLPCGREGMGEESPLSEPLPVGEPLPLSPAAGREAAGNFRPGSPVGKEIFPLCHVNTGLSQGYLSLLPLSDIVRQMPKSVPVSPSGWCGRQIK